MAANEERRRQPLKRLGLYERSLQQRAERERKLQRIRAQVEKDYTFTPKTPQSRSSSNDTATTKAATTDSVFDRLYPGSGSPSTPAKSLSSIKKNLARMSVSPTETWSQTSTLNSIRIEELYEEGVRKLRTRPRNDETEKKLRDRRYEERDLQFCTFRPSPNVALATSRKSHLIIMEPNQKKRDSSSPTSQTENRLPPREIIVTQHHRAFSKNKPWRSPERRTLRVTELHRFLPRNDVLDDPSRASVSVMPSVATEYGSI